MMTTPQIPGLVKSQIPIENWLVALAQGLHPAGHEVIQVFWSKYADEYPFVHTHPFDEDVSGTRYAGRRPQPREQLEDPRSASYWCQRPFVGHGWVMDEEFRLQEYFVVVATPADVANARRELGVAETPVMRTISRLVHLAKHQQQFVGIYGPDLLPGLGPLDGGDQDD